MAKDKLNKKNMTDEVIKVLEAAAERYAEDICQEIARDAFLTPPERKAHKEIARIAYFQGAYETFEVLRDKFKTN